MPKNLKRAGVVALVFAFVALVLASAPSIAKARVFAYVQSHEAELTEYVQSAPEAAGSYNGWAVDSFPESGMVQFTTSGLGLVPSSSYMGFYYSPDDVPLAFQSTDQELVPDSTGWSWSDASGDNHGRTERISPRWFWFEASF